MPISGCLRSIIVNAPRISMATDAGTETEYGFTTTSEKLEKTCDSHGKILKRINATGRERRLLTALESQNSGREIPIFFFYVKSCI